MKKLAAVIIGSFLIASVAYADGPIVKFSRGLVNIVTSPGELLIQPAIIHETENLPIAITAGLIRGIGMTVARIGVGVYDIVTFPIPLPRDYEPVFRPETTLEALEQMHSSRSEA